MLTNEASTYAAVESAFDAYERALTTNDVRAMQMLCIVGLVGLPQVGMPWVGFDGTPLSLSIGGARGDDRGVLAAARTIRAALAA